MFKAIKKLLSKIKDVAIKSLSVFYDFVEEVEEEMVAVEKARLEEMVALEEVRLEEKKLYLDMAKFVMNWLTSCTRYVLESVSNCAKSVFKVTGSVLKDDQNTMVMGAIGAAVAMFSLTRLTLRKLIKT